ncbi:cytochrome P450 [Cupriavidus metallidurans]|uniref:Cytochrome P450 n=1 Tax=Cupriavidus metallidurans (strain ATCC 43123 / DSM 2839 / NBRC 102507 / CH34) TaxID=266264 RepID=Q1LBV1_CUPMC|nr:cytochrome P450 [Cupriavidus metallidurans]ABF12375.1 cytochrome P450 [Cupriavidus metallidurans CH34]QGS32395.1 cytochrome P450 [Cupriavidus metallidurans]
MTIASDFDTELASHEIYSDPERMHEMFETLRREDPVHWTTAPGHPPFWAVTKQADVIEVGKHPDVFIASPKSFLMNDVEQRVRIEETAATGGKLVRTMIHMDDPDHKKYRGLTQSYFMPANIKRLESVIQERARALVGRLIEKGTSEFCSEIAVWYPLQIVMTLLDVPESEHPYLLKLTQQFLAPKDPTLRRDGPDERGKGAVAKEYFAYFGKMLAERRAAPLKEDLGSLIAHATVDGEPLPLMEAVSYYVILATAGHDTTSSSMCSGLYYLLTQPGELDRLRARPELMPSAIEEMFRHGSPVKHFVRTATRDFELRGKKIQAGDEVALMYHSASFDEEVFDEPRSFRIDRGPNKHVAFGFGIHACLGQNLARASMRTFFTELLARTESIEVVGKAEFIASNQVGGMKTLNIRVTPSKQSTTDRIEVAA